MKLRARMLYSGEKLTVFLLSNKDIFLLKGMTERDRDLEDMAILARHGLFENLSRPSVGHWNFLMMSLDILSNMTK